MFTSPQQSISRPLTKQISKRINLKILTITDDKSTPKNRFSSFRFQSPLYTEHGNKAAPRIKSIIIWKNIIVSPCLGLIVATFKLYKCWWNRRNYRNAYVLSISTEILLFHGDSQSMWDGCLGLGCLSQDVCYVLRLKYFERSEEQ